MFATKNKLLFHSYRFYHIRWQALDRLKTAGAFPFWENEIITYFKREIKKKSTSGPPKSNTRFSFFTATAHG
jgi:hypothetical protein